MLTRFDHAYVLNVLSDDHPGIIAAVSDAVGQFSGNIDACSQTVLGGYFSLIMIVSLPQDLPAQDLAAAVGGRGGLSLQVQARSFAAAKSENGGADTFVLTAFGPDKPGIIKRLSHYLSGKDINIIDLYWNRQASQFVMVSQLAIPPHWQLGMLQVDLEQIASEMGFAVRLQHENIFVATNQLRLKTAGLELGS